MKGVLYPLVGVLQISETVFSLLSFTPELGIVATGFVASSLIALIYLVPLALVISYLKRYTPSFILICALGIIWLSSLAAIGLAELTQSTNIMMTASGTFVLATMSLTLLIALHQIPKLFDVVRKKYVRLIN
jgi:hypothetical protein